MNKKDFYMGEFENNLEILVTERGTWITDCNLDDTVYIPNKRFDDFVQELINMKESYDE